MVGAKIIADHSDSRFARGSSEIALGVFRFGTGLIDGHSGFGDCVRVNTLESNARVLRLLECLPKRNVAWTA